MAATFYRILLEDVVFEGKVLDGAGDRVLTSEPNKDGTVLVLSSTWYQLPLAAFEDDAEPFTT